MYSVGYTFIMSLSHAFPLAFTARHQLQPCHSDAVHLQINPVRIDGWYRRGVPGKDADIRLGDVVVSKLTGNFGTI